MAELRELRELRAERKNFDSALEEQMRRGDEYWAENVRLRAALEQLKDYFDLGEVVFEVSGRFVHAEKLINDTLANEKEATSA